MSHPCQLVGIIEIDADTSSGAQADGTLGDTLCRLRAGGGSRVRERAEADITDWCSPDLCPWELDRVLEADLPQLLRELDAALRILVLRTPCLGLSLRPVCRQ
jgi:hypothetical protein